VGKTLRKIAITGPESTGKSNLARGLAQHYQTAFVPEFAREYIDALTRPYNQDDILTIAKNQLLAEKDAEKKAQGFLFCDTELIVTKVWSLHKFNSCHPWILQKIVENPYDLFLLCDIDLPWEFDEQREHPHLREYFMNWYRRELENYGFNYRVVSGEGDVRLKNAIAAIENI